MIDSTTLEEPIELLNKYKCKNEEKVEWIACGAWVIKSLFDRGLMKGFTPEGIKRLKLINTGYTRASKNKYKSDAFDYLMMSDKIADDLPEEDFIHLKDLYEKYEKVNAR